MNGDGDGLEMYQMGCSVVRLLWNSLLLDLNLLILMLVGTEWRWGATCVMEFLHFQNMLFLKKQKPDLPFGIWLHLNSIFKPWYSYLINLIYWEMCIKIILKRAGKCPHSKRKSGNIEKVGIGSMEKFSQVIHNKVACWHGSCNPLDGDTGPPITYAEAVRAFSQLKKWLLKQEKCTFQFRSLD